MDVNSTRDSLSFPAIFLLLGDIESKSFSCYLFLALIYNYATLKV